MDFSFFTQGSSFGRPFVVPFNGLPKSYTSIAPLSFEDFDSKDMTLLPAKASKTDEESPCDFFAATRQSTDITSFSENTPIDISNFFDMQGDSQPMSNFSLIDSINWDTNYVMPQNQVLQQDQHQPEFQNHYPIWSNNSSHSEMDEVEDNNKAMASKEQESEGWNEKDSKKLLKLAELHKNDWKKIAKIFNNKKYTPNFLKGKHKEAMDFSAQKRIKFTHKEDLMIASYFEKYGSNWTKMATFFENRTGIMLKNRYYSFIRKKNLLVDLLKEGKGFDASDKPESPSLPCEDMNEAEMSMEKGNEDHQKEIKLLNMKIKSLESLCMTTRRELQKLKNGSF